MENMSENQELGSELVAANQQHLFVEGYFSSRAMNGERPVYGYPTNHLPKTDSSMTIKTSFFS